MWSETSGHKFNSLDFSCYYDYLGQRDFVHQVPGVPVVPVVPVVPMVPGFCRGRCCWRREAGAREGCRVNGGTSFA